MKQTWENGQKPSSDMIPEVNLTSRKASAVSVNEAGGSGSTLSHSLRL